MSKIPTAWQRWGGGISDFRHESLIPDSYYFGRSIDVRTEPHHVMILPRTVKESGTVVTDLIKWADIYNPTLDVYAYGDTGNFYKRTSARVYSLLRSINTSHGNGLAYNPEDNFFYYTEDKAIGRYGPMSATTPTFTDDFLGAQGGVPLNTNSLSLVAASSQYAYSADTDHVSITGDIAIEAQIKPTTLPAISNSMTLVSKWTGTGNLRSYKFDIACVSGYFGAGTETFGTAGSLAASDIYDDGFPGTPLIDASCTGVVAEIHIHATNTSFATDQIILIHQTQGTGAGTWQRNTIAGYSAGLITLANALNATYTTGAQVLVLRQYGNVTIGSGKTLTAKAWDGTVGGILAFLASGTVTVTGTISANGGSGTSSGAGDGVTATGGSGGGFRGGSVTNGGTTNAYAGEGTAGASVQQRTANGNGGGGAYGSGSFHNSGAGGGNGTVGVNGGYDSNYGIGGTIVGTADLTTMELGGGGGAGADNQAYAVQSGGAGGGIVFISSTTIIITGSVTVNGGAGGTVASYSAGGGGGAGGSILIKAQTATLGASLITASGGAGGAASSAPPGGDGGVGRIHLDYYTSYTGTTSPTLDVTLDNNLVTNTSYQLRFAVSNDGTANETLARTVNLITGVWQQVAVSWDASAKTATFFLNSVSQGTSTGTINEIVDNASEFFIGCDKPAATATNFYNGLIDEARVYAAERTASQFLEGSNTQIAIATVGLRAYYQFNANLTDITANDTDLTGSGTPTYSTDVPFSSPTTRLDLDQTSTTSGDEYTLALTSAGIDETATHRKTFTPGKDPQKSIALSVVAAGSGAWTLTVHDSLNNTMASKTVLAAALAGITGYYEFTFTSVWRPLTNFTNNYHFHLTSTVADGTVLTTTHNDLETVSYRSYYQFLVEDIAWHPITRFLNFIVFGNERYVGKYEATLYEPNKIVFGAGWRARCFGYWQEYLAIGCMKGANIYDYDQGRIYFWDGYSPIFNFYIDVPEGGINALLGTRGQLYIWAGWHADLLVYEGGSSAKKLKEVPLLTPSDYAEVFPQAVAMWQANPRYGLAGNSNSDDINKAVYTYGSKNYRYPDTLTCDYPISTGNYLDTVKIGMILPFNKELLVSWKDNVSCGVDYINVTNAPYPTAYLEMMVEDLDIPYKEKQATQLVATFDPLLTGESINVKYMNEETDTTWNTNSESPAVGDITVRKIVPNGRYFHMRIGVDLSTTGSTTPTLKSVVLETDKNEEEDRIG